MKRELFQNILALPYSSGDAIDRESYLSAVVGATVGSTGKLTVTIEHSDDGKSGCPRRRSTNPRGWSRSPTIWSRLC